MSKYLAMLDKIANEVKTLQSDFARANWFIIAEAVSRGHLTSIHLGRPANRWFITSKGHRFLSEHLSTVGCNHE